MSATGNIGKHVKATAKDNYGTRADGVPASVLVGIVSEERFIGDESYVTLDLDNTLTSISIDYDEWDWQILPGRNF